MLKIALIDEIYNASDVADLGLTINGSNAVFKTWTPLATKVMLVLYSDSGAETEVSRHEMTRGEKGVWTYSGSYGNAKYYQYHITNNATESHVSDIWHTVAGPDSVASQIASISDEAAVPVGWEKDYTNPFGKNGDEAKLYSDAVIYEMHIRDWSRIENPNSTGKFLDIAKSEEIISHLTDLGVTHVQILPMFDYAQKNDDENYNWGYNPYHYNVPEGRYVTEGYTDGTQAVKEMRTMIKKLHEAGIAVIMDVVYNHTNGTGSGSLYDMTVPEYFYRMNGSAYSDGSGCGNEVATNHKMVKKYVIDSLKHWMTDYHINGFRFDLMGLHEKETMKDIYEELSQIDPNVMVYGEPWTAKNSPVEKGMTGAVETTPGYGVGAFDDDFRDAIKGAEYGGFNKGQVQGVFNDEGILLGLCGKSGKNKRNETEELGLALHYVECHDNYTLFDKLAYSTVPGISGDDIVSKFPATLTEEQLALIKKQDKLAAAYIFLAQGTPFINGGQEFMRTKQGNPDSYAADTKGGKTWTEAEVNKCNTVDLSFKTTYSDVYNTYKGLIALRKANPSAFGSNKDAKAETVKDADGKNINGVTKYTTGDFLVYFNATDEAVDITTSGYKKAVDVSRGTPTESATLPDKVPAKSFVILKK
ncbi:MAG: alpha-amylase [Treponema sp.]|nr:alpha-amylase [Treponema sp.]